jgi:hypothetical protein
MQYAVEDMPDIVTTDFDSGTISVFLSTTVA